jgi:cell division protein FtsA
VRITRAQLVSVIRQRLEHLTAQIEGALKALGFAGPFGRQVVLTGGGAELKGIADYAQGVLGRAVRIGRPAMAGLPEAHSGPAFATLAGLALFAASNELDLRSGFATPGSEGKSGGNVLQRLIAAFRTQY